MLLTTCQSRPCGQQAFWAEKPSSWGISVGQPSNTPPQLKSRSCCGPTAVCLQLSPCNSSLILGTQVTRASCRGTMEEEKEIKTSYSLKVTLVSQ